MKKLCKKCNIEKDIKDFGKRKHTGDGLETSCRRCYQKRTDEWKAANPEKRYKSTFKSALKRKFSLTLEQYQEMLDKQLCSCALCFKIKKKEDKALAVDHCHDTGKIRGLLCSECNLMLGLAKDNKETLKRALEYLDD